MRTKHAAVSPAQPRPERPNRCRNSEEVYREGSSAPQRGLSQGRLAGLSALELGDCTFMQQRGAVDRATHKRCQYSERLPHSLQSVRFIDIDQ